MRTNLLKLVALALAPVALLSITSCSEKMASEKTTVIETPDGAIVVDTVSMTATVTGIDAAKRNVTLVTPEGHKTTYKAGPEVVNFDQIKVGDQIKAVMTEQVAVSIGSGAAPSGMSDGAVALAPVGAKPGGVMVDTSRVTAKVIAVDAAKHKITFELPDAVTKTVKVGKKVDLSAVKIGDNVTIQVSDGLLITVQKP